jgi:hypothetical protein
MLEKPETVPEFDGVTIRHRGRESQRLVIVGRGQTLRSDDVAVKVNELHAVKGDRR